MLSLRHVVHTRRCVALPCPLGAPLAVLQEVHCEHVCSLSRPNVQHIVSGAKLSPGFDILFTLVLVRCDDSQLDGSTI